MSRFLFASEVGKPVRGESLDLLGEIWVVGVGVLSCVTAERHAEGVFILGFETFVLGDFEQEVFFWLGTGFKPVGGESLDLLGEDGVIGFVAIP